MTTPPTIHPARRLWLHLETLHGVVYFAPQFTDDLKAIGMKGFWMSYFAGRAAPFGAIGPGPVEATFYNFDPKMVRRAIPDAWRFAEPAMVLGTRASSAAAVLRTLIPDVEAQAERIVPLLSSAVRTARPDGRALFAANQQLPLPEDPVAALWQCATSLREHRGDGHVALLVAGDISGLEAHQLVVGAGAIGDDRLRSVRGWSEEAWAVAKERVTARGLLDDGGRLTDVGRELRDEVERRTDELAHQPYVDGLTAPGLDLLPALLRPLSAAVRSADVIPVPNPIGFAPPE